MQPRHVQTPLLAAGELEHTQVALLFEANRVTLFIRGRTRIGIHQAANIHRERTRLAGRCFPRLN